MKLNNKGFAVSAIIYSVLVLFLLILIAFLSLMSSARIFANKSNEGVIESLTEEIIPINQMVGVGGVSYYMTPYSGNYLIVASGKQGYIYLPKNTSIQNGGVDGTDVIFNGEMDNVISLANPKETENKYIFNNVTDSMNDYTSAIRIVSVYAIKND